MNTYSLHYIEYIFIRVYKAFGQMGFAQKLASAQKLKILHKKSRFGGTNTQKPLAFITHLCHILI
jgi:hypothetical protein